MEGLNIEKKCDKIDLSPRLAPSSSGLGRLVLIQKIAGSTPAGVTKNLTKL